jgi:hypothetical protein
MAGAGWRVADGSRNSALSPMISAASARDSIPSRSGSIGTASGATPKTRCSSTVDSATDVRELVSIAIDRMSDGSTRV